jgi:hypothetical protein
MSESQPKRGRKKVEKGYLLSRSFRFQEEDVARLEELSRRWRCSTAAVIRRLLAEAIEEPGAEKKVQ